MSIVGTRKIWYLFSAILVLGSLAAWLGWGLKPGIEFTGGSLVELKFQKAPTGGELRDLFKASGVESANVVISPASISVRASLITPEIHAKILTALKEKDANFSELRFDAIGPSISAELRQRAVTAVTLTLITVFLYVAWAYRKVSGRVRAWKYGALVVFAGLHDAIIPVGVFAALGHFKGVEIDGAFVAAILTILGYSINDTIIIFDRIRENMLKLGGEVAVIVEKSVKQSIMRSINTTATVLLALLAIYIFGGSTTQNFALALFIGIASGAYSSIFLASPLIVSWQKKNA